jgi:hypothetical protein
MRLLRRITSARHIDAAVIGVLHDETDAIWTLDRQLGAPAVAPKLEAHIDQLQDSLRHSLSPAAASRSPPPCPCHRARSARQRRRITDLARRIGAAA